MIFQPDSAQLLILQVRPVLHFLRWAQLLGCLQICLLAPDDGDFLLHLLHWFAKSFKILIMNIKVCWPQRKVLTFPASVAARAAEPEGSTTSPLLWRARHVSLSWASPGDLQVIKIVHKQKVPDLLFCNQNHSINIGRNMLSQSEQSMKDEIKVDHSIKENIHHPSYLALKDNW